MSKLPLFQVSGFGQCLGSRSDDRVHGGGISFRFRDSGFSFGYQVSGFEFSLSGIRYLSDTTYLLISFRKSTAPQNRQLNI